MELRVNGETRQIDEGATLVDLLAHLDISPDATGIAVAVNETVVARESWRSRALADGDTVEIIRAVQGG